MSVQRRLLQLAIGICALTSVFVEPAAARYCYWDGSSPFCRGQCPRGWTVKSIRACFNGYKLLCCEPQGFISQGVKRR